MMPKLYFEACFLSIGFCSLMYACGSSGAEPAAAGPTAGTTAAPSGGQSGQASVAGTTAAPSGGTQGVAGKPAGGAGGSGLSRAPTFTAIYEEILANSCSGPICHSGTTGGNLQMATKEGAYKALVSAPAQGTSLPGICTGMPPNCKDIDAVRVVPNDPEKSLLLDKITEEQPRCGCRMPTSPPPLPEAAVEQIRMWIMSGAPNN